MIQKEVIKKEVKERMVYTEIICKVVEAEVIEEVINKEVKEEVVEAEVMCKVVETELMEEVKILFA